MDIRSIEFHRASYEPGDFPRDGRPQIAVVGRSNVGKSSLINAVLNRKNIARVSQTPGKTQAIQFYLINSQFYLVDLPGYGYAKVPKVIQRTWGELIRSYLESAETLRLMIVLLDARRVPGEHDLRMHGWTTDLDIPEQLVLTKTDKLSTTQLNRTRAEIATEMKVDAKSLISFSAVTKRGIEELRRAMYSKL